MTSRNPRNSRFRWIAGSLALVIATAFLTTKVVSDDKNPPKGKGPVMTPEQQKMMEACTKAGTPGAEHKRLGSMAGNWNTTAKFWMDPSAPASESKGTTTFKSILGGRWITQEHESNMPEMGPFSGFGLEGYDNVSKKYISIWTDSMGTGAMISEGTPDASGKIITYISQFNDPVTAKAKTVRSVSRFLSESAHVFEMYDNAPDGKEYKNLEVTYTRK
jgi:hypothetical protein